MANKYVRPCGVRLYTNPPFRDVSGAYFDPTTVTCTITDPVGTTTAKTLAAGQVVKNTGRGFALGDFYFDLDLTAATDSQLGYWIYTWSGAGATGSPSDKNVLILESEKTR